MTIFWRKMRSLFLARRWLVAESSATRKGRRPLQDPRWQILVVTRQVTDEMDRIFACGRVWFPPYALGRGLCCS